jgi:hypothetical protein
MNKYLEGEPGKKIVRHERHSADNEALASSAPTRIGLLIVVYLRLAINGLGFIGNEAMSKM